MDIIDELRAWPARGDGSDGMSAHTVGGIMNAAADEIERLRLFERYANRTIEGQVEDAIAYKAEHGKYPFED